MDQDWKAAKWPLHFFFFLVANTGYSFSQFERALFCVALLSLSPVIFVLVYRQPSGITPLPTPTLVCVTQLSPHCTSTQCVLLYSVAIAKKKLNTYFIVNFGVPNEELMMCQNDLLSAVFPLLPTKINSCLIWEEEKKHSVCSKLTPSRTEYFTH